MDKKSIKDFVWNTVGSMLFGFTSLFLMIIITRINGMEIAGAFTYAFAIASILCTIGSYCGKTFQITETDENISDTDYIFNRLFTCLIMNLIAVIFCFITQPSALKTELIIILTIYRSIDAFVESFHAIIQRNGSLYKVGISLFIKTILLIVTFIICDVLTNNIVYSMISIVIANIIFCYIYDYHNIKNIMIKTKFCINKNNKLLKSGFALFCHAFLSVYVINAPKYALNNYVSDELQAVFGIIIMPASFLALISQYIVQPFLNNITDKVKNNEYKSLKKMVFNLSLIIFGIGVLAIVCCYFLGIPILELVYGVDLNTQKLNLLIIIVGSILYSMIILISAILVAMRKTFIQLVILLIVGLISIVVCNYLAMSFGLLGGSISYTVIMAIEFILYMVSLIVLINRRIK